MRHSRFLKVASATSATIALLAGSAIAPSFAAEDTTQVTSAAAAITTNTVINLPNGILAQTDPAATVAADGTATGYTTVAPEDYQSLVPFLSSGKTELKVDEADRIAVDLTQGGPTVAALPEGSNLLGDWTVSDSSVLSLGFEGAVLAEAPGTATVTFTPAVVSNNVVTLGAPSISFEVTVVGEATETPTPAPSETATPAPSETATPAPSETATPAPSETATPAPSETATPAPSETATPAPSETAAPAPVVTETPAATEAPAPVAPAVAEPVPASTSLYENCADVHAKVGHSITTNDAGYEAKLDRDGDGEACELTPDYVNADGGVLAEDGSYATTNPSNTSYNDGAYYTNGETLANTGFGAVGIFAGGMVLLGAGTAAVVVSRRKTESE